MKYDPALYRRTHTCGELTTGQKNEVVNLVGWVNKRRDLGGLIFIELRDRYGITQVVINTRVDEAVFHTAESLKSEYVIAVKGNVVERPEGTCKANLATGDIEVHATGLIILATSRALPFNMTEGVSIDEMLRMKYRYLDLRKPGMVARMVLRHKVAKAVRDYFDSKGFLEIETPVLVRSTPEGARDYLVPSRMNGGKFYALPQSPQLFKQLLMVGGMDRYFQLARCFRDEDLRADRQPEFTQIDMEMSFVSQDDILSMIEDMLARLFRQALSVELPIPFPRLTYRQAMERYGSDKPDLRPGMEIEDISDLAAAVEFEVFAKTLKEGGRVKAICLQGMAHLSRKETDDLINLGKSLGLKGVLTMASMPDGVKSYLCKFMSREVQEKLLQVMGASPGDLIIIGADEGERLCDLLGKFRLQLAARFKLIPPGLFKFLWVIDFPLFRYNKEEDRIEAEHHPFTSPCPEDVLLMESEPLKVRANAYDIVLNGVELGSGSIRIHERSMQEKLFAAIGLSADEAQAKFGFLLSAFEFGAPPHGGIALGFDRLVTIMSGVESIRDVVAFPKNQSAACPLTGAPVEVTGGQLELLKIKVEVLKEATGEDPVKIK